MSGNPTTRPLGRVGLAPVVGTALSRYCRPQCIIVAERAPKVYIPTLCFFGPYFPRSC
jgi:hypothetical protein